jgi:biopolymer transport protein ExbB
LLTTAVGLAVAIPVSLIHSWFDSQRSGLAQLFSDDIGRLATATVDQEAHKAEKKPATCGDL